MEEKKCNKCNRVLPIEQFPMRSGRTYRYLQCIDCRHKMVTDAHRKKHPLIEAIEKTCIVCGNKFTTIYHSKKRCSAKCLSPRKVYLSSLTPEQRIEEKKQYYKQWSDANIDKRKQWNIDNKERIKTKRKEYRASLSPERRKELNRKKKLKEKARAKTDPIYATKQTAHRRTYKKNRCELDINFRLAQNIRKRVFLTLRYGRKYTHTLELLGCSIEDARMHIERQFQSGMTWDNWAVDGWHIDHIIPIASFDLTDVEQQKRCFHYTNLQPLWALDNYRKHDKIIEKQLCLM